MLLLLLLLRSPSLLLLLLEDRTGWPIAAVPLVPLVASVSWSGTSMSSDIFTQFHQTLIDAPSLRRARCDRPRSLLGVQWHVA